MALYRALGNLSKGSRQIDAGAVFSENELDPAARRILLERKRIAPVAAPPLSEIPGWRKRSKALPDMNLDEFIERDSAELAQILSVGLDQVEAWKAALVAHLEAPPPEYC